MRKKKILAVSVSMLLSVHAVLPQPIVYAQTASDTQEAWQEKAVTDYSQYEHGELLVLYQDGTSEKEKERIFSAVNLKERTKTADFCDKITLKEESDVEQAVESIAKNKAVAYVQPNFQYQMTSTASSAEDVAEITESAFSKQWWIYNDGTFEEPEETGELWMPSYPFYPDRFWPFSAGQAAQQKDLWDWDSSVSSVIKAAAGMDTNTAKAWNRFSDGGRKVLVAVIDTGIDYTHSQIKNSIWTNTGEIPDNGIDDDGNGYIDDVYGWDFYYDTNEVYAGTSKIRGSNENEDEHGTHVAGIIAAAKDGVGIAGIASNADVEIMSLKVLGGKNGSGDTESIVKAIAYAQEKGAVICNMSFGMGEHDMGTMQNYDQAMKEAIQQSSMLFVAAAGNGEDRGTDNDAVGVFPASYDFDNVIAVANLRYDGTLDPSSHYGAESVDLAAPGACIYSTLPEEQYGYMSGTSMSTPMVTAACAMAYAYAKNPDVLAIRERILANVTKNSALTGKVSTGGMLNVYDAVADLAENTYAYTGQKENADEGEAKADTTQEPNDDAIGTQWIQDGMIYTILSDSSAAVAGIVKSSAKKLVIADEVVYKSKHYAVTKIKKRAFYKNQSVTSVIIGKNVKTIGKQAFFGCTNLKKVSGMEAVENIRSGAFRKCVKLVSVTLTSSAVNIADTAFRGCKKLS